jgi:hypothetical protein
LKIVNWLKSLFANNKVVTKTTNNKNMNARFFYAPHINHQNGKSTWPKLYVLIKDGTLYCEYLDYMKPSKIVKSFNYDSFKSSDYSYEGYQHLEEISYEIAASKSLTQQSNWINNYLRSKDLL